MQIKLPFHIPINYKTIIIGILTAIIIILLILSLIIPKNRQGPIIQTIIPSAKTTSTPAPAKKLPTEIQTQLNSIDTQLNSPSEIAPPPLDDSIGL